MTAHVIQHQYDLDQVVNLLRSHQLPTQDVALNQQLMIGYRDEQNNLIGSGGLEFYAGGALLRSVAVREDLRGRSIGKQIVSDLISRARQQAVPQIFLLTETAHDYFKTLGFTDTPRESVPESVRVSTEFSSVCPVSAACMRLDLTRTSHQTS